MYTLDVIFCAGPVGQCCSVYATTTSGRIFWQFNFCAGAYIQICTHIFIQKFSSIVQWYQIVESLLRRDCPTMRSSKWFRTALFMLMSAIIMDSSSRLRNNVFWFLQPHRIEAQSKQPEKQNALASPWLDWLFPCASHACQHKGNCDTFISNGFKTYRNVGLILEIVRITFSCFTQLRQSPANMLEIFAAKMKYRFVFFLVGYATLNRVCPRTIVRLTP